MSRTRVRVKIDHARMTVVVGGLTRESAQRAAEVSVKRYKRNIRASGFGSGKMYREVTSKTVSNDPFRPQVAVGTAVDYAHFQEFGTRAHGPVRAKALRFKPKGSNSFVFAKWVRGVKPARFAQKTLDMVRPTDFE